MAVKKKGIIKKKAQTNIPGEAGSNAHMVANKAINTIPGTDDQNMVRKTGRTPANRK